MKFLKVLCLAILIVGCESDDVPLDTSLILSEILENTSFETGAVIACASSTDGTNNQVSIYFYPEANAENFKLYQTESVSVNPNDFSNYRRVDVPDMPIFNGFLRQFTRTLTHDKWYIVTFTIANDIKVSNPIRTKQFSKPTALDQTIFINQEAPQMPSFSWEADADDAIYFHIVSDLQNNVFSGTYTTETNFQYYNTSNVVLNVTEGNPPNLNSGESYHFALMGVSEDNWVNTLTVNHNFTIE